MQDVRALQVIPGELVKPFKSNFPSRLAQSRVELVEKLLAELGADNSGFTLENVMTVKDLKTHEMHSSTRPLMLKVLINLKYLDCLV